MKGQNKNKEVWKMKQRDVNLYVAEVMNNHLGRLNAIKFQDIEAIIVPMGATKSRYGRLFVF